MDTNQKEAQRLLYEHRIEKLPLVDAEGKLTGMITAQDIEKREQYLNAAKDNNGQLMVGSGESGLALTTLSVLKQ